MNRENWVITTLTLHITVVFESTKRATSEKGITREALSLVAMMTAGLCVDQLKNFTNDILPPIFKRNFISHKFLVDYNQLLFVALALHPYIVNWRSRTGLNRKAILLFTGSKS